MMNREYLSQLVQRSLDDALAPPERDELTRALRDDPLLREEAEDMKATSASCASMFRQLALPADFSQRVMKRIQPLHVPADDKLSTEPRLPHLRRGRMPGRGSGRGVYWVGAVAAAALVALAVSLVMQLSGQINPNRSTSGSSQAAGVPGVPGSSGGNRTDPLDQKPEKREPSNSTTNPGGSQPEKSPTAPGQGSGDLPDLPPDHINNGPQPEAPVKAPDTPDNASEPGAGKNPVVTEPERTPAEPGKDPARETSPLPAQPDRPAMVARLSILGGKAQMLQPDGKWRDMASDEELRPDVQIRTNVNGNASIVFSTGAVTLGHNSRLTVVDADVVTLEDGTVAIDRADLADGGSLAVKCDAYVFYMMHGAGSLERKRRGLSVQHFVGLSSLTHDEFGSVIFEKTSTLDMDFGKDYPTAKAAPGLTMPSWLADARSMWVFAQLEPKLTERAFSARERREVDKNLPRALDRLLAYPMEAGNVVDFLTRVLEGNDKFKADGTTTVRMVGELETAILEMKDTPADHLAFQGGRAAMVAADFANWRETFLRLAKGDATKPPQATIVRRTTTIIDGKIRRVDDPPPQPRQPAPDQPQEPAGK
ncbi:MAG: hypothetical protein IPP14_14165 [Planctomycetes bacterium]|nr:hypothetical protein [Planctomycetota bacterium]